MSQEDAGPDESTPPGDSIQEALALAKKVDLGSSFLYTRLQTILKDGYTVTKTLVWYDLGKHVADHHSILLEIKKHERKYSRTYWGAIAVLVAIVLLFFVFGRVLGFYGPFFSGLVLVVVEFALFRDLNRLFGEIHGLHLEADTEKIQVAQALGVMKEIAKILGCNLESVFAIKDSAPIEGAVSRALLRLLRDAWEKENALRALAEKGEKKSITEAGASAEYADQLFDEWYSVFATLKFVTVSQRSLWQSMKGAVVEQPKQE